MGSPLAGTCFDILHDACFDPDGACVEEAVGPVSTWQWDNGTSLVFEVAGFDESGTNYLTKMTGVNSAGEACIEGVMELLSFEGKRILTFDVGGTIIKREDFFDAKTLPYTEYTCSDGSFFQVPLEGQVWRMRACSDPMLNPVVS